ncbi:nicotinate phosphoribosyltransferase [Sulfolobus acidocaldarius]|uniref:nicotinate phosphoribosyltransferase n=4 Tax=Sulfolobus acidocaldarius TaxID=2285 RepID=Q4J8T9_SULAC|nr:nicotinate phosphoribosyltransferase [Sulfolobus acidocaldarius]AAY80791.1 quinolinate phosphoribosyl transferase [Sulfolobus acidocaldarius DSM 639]AGE71390.1 nicotinate phosphoribosyltransferase [Sulfolobus acidocaldarius N8]AGE73661.1 nicotinate phosphoribosyltransferase [Sulfolobus acidocaldarius Ron12/I]ALU30364.1 nicotinate phosphoribosyltransferase [Sulfolobus acidocaldarius]ALU31082.1 nicotinate phosphoribosyltransferase [Sulfolobus acidocaldarius]
MRFYIANERDILDGKMTDIYFDRTIRTLEHLGIKDLKVRMEVHSYGLPEGYSWAIFSGLEEVLKLLEGKEVTVYAMPEGTVFKEVEPVMIIEGNYLDFGVFETAFLGILRHYSSISTKAARIKKLALDKTVLFFGLRALHPAIAPMVDRAAYIGGCDGVSGAFNQETIGAEPTGTMPHALMLSVGDNVKAWKAFDEAMPSNVPRIILADTFEDERTEVLKAAELLKDKLYGVRLDTPSSRRGNFRKIVQEIRWTLNIHGYGHIKIFVSGGIDEDDVVKLRDVVDGFGVGTSISFPQSVDFSADIVEKYVNGQWIPFTKRGKWPGAKQVYRCGDSPDGDIITLLDDYPPANLNCKPLLVKYIENGKIIRDIPTAKEIREYVISQLKKLPNL